MAQRDEGLSRPSARIRFCRITRKESILNKHRLCKPVAKKDTIYNAVIKEFYLKPRREVMGSYASFGAACDSTLVLKFSNAKRSVG